MENSFIHINFIIHTINTIKIINELNIKRKKGKYAFYKIEQT